MPAIEAIGLTKQYGRSTAVHDVTFSADAGRITALLGPNGCGKSTTLRMMLGLTRASRGLSRFGGRAFRELENPGREIGVSIDAGAQHPGRSVRETAGVAGALIGVTKDRVDDCLALVGLETVHRRRVGALSLGMRQRLGLAVALLGSPHCLVLDEPANGLDPEGIKWLHGSLIAFARAGGAVLLSSHHLREIESLADDAVILDRGRLVYAGSASPTASRKSEVSSDDDERLLRALEAALIPCARTTDGLVVDAEPEEVGRIALNERLVLSRLDASSPGLEKFFLDSTVGEFAARGTATADGRVAA